MKLLSSTPRRPRSAAFSLVEVMVAVGITAVGIVTLLGLLPSSLSNIRRAANDGVEARVMQAIMADYQMRDWPSILRQQESAAAEMTYFDLNGFPVKSADSEAFLLAQINVVDAPLLPGATVPNPRLRMLRVRTSRDVLAGAAAFDNKHTFRQTQAILPQMDKSP
ncbi:MAG: Verru_Chthon cassette protein B [Prosthecobacter sp.]|uniref:Verru_Chthon cassette protein B n=1 Tax=Prosthecobacter sp. TaxID=1965333 RepID=UPI0039037BCB